MSSMPSMKCSKWVLIVPGKVHHVAGVAVAMGGQQQHLVGDDPAGPAAISVGTDHVDVERQVRPVLLDRAARQDADLAQLDRVVDLGPGEFLVAPLGRGLAGHVYGSVIYAVCRRLVAAAFDSAR